MDKNTLGMHIHTIRGLIHYHERMSLPYRKACPGCSVGQNMCPSAMHQDIYRQALEVSLVLLEREYGRMALDEEVEKSTIGVKERQSD